MDHGFWDVACELRRRLYGLDACLLGQAVFREGILGKRDSGIELDVEDVE